MTKNSTFPIAIGIILFILLITACEKYDLDRKEFLIEISTDEVTVSGITITVGGTISALGKGVQDHGHVWATTANPTVDDNKTSLGITSSEVSYTSNISDLEYNTSYYIRAYAFDGEDYFYGEEKSFITSDLTLVDTDTFEVISYSSVQATGLILSIGNDNIIQHGHCWSLTNPSPSIIDSKTELGNSISIGNFTSILPSLNTGDSYFYRSYIKTDEGEIYGAVKILNIEEHSVITNTVNITSDSTATIEGTLTTLYEVSEHGHCWSSVDTLPTINNTKTEFGALQQSGSFSTNLNNLTPGEIYYVRAYATVGNLIKYGEVKSIEITDAWIQKANFGGTVRTNAVGFSIGDKGYIGTGIDAPGSIKKDFWEYDPITNIWTQKADLGGNQRQNAVGFSIGSKGYIGIGYDGFNHLNDFWEYNPTTNIWTQKADFGGFGISMMSVGFSIGSKGYIGTGWNHFLGNSTDDFWEYNPITDSWTQKADFGGGVRAQTVGFSIGNKGYIGTGEIMGVGRKKDFWEYDPLINTWTQKADFGGDARSEAVGFSIGNKGYIGTGWDNPLKKDFWEYDSINDTWEQKADFKGVERFEAVGFSIGNRGYIGTGGYKKDFYEYIPD